MNAEYIRKWNATWHEGGIMDEAQCCQTWGEQRAPMYPQATFDVLEAGHLLQESHGLEISNTLMQRISEE